MMTKKQQRLRRARQTRIRIADKGVARLSVNRTNLHIYATVVSEDGAKVLASASTAEADMRKELGAAGKGGNVAAAERIGKAHVAPVVLLTAFSQTELVERARDAGAMAYVVKPFSPADLLPAVEIAISRYAQITALSAEVADLTERFETRKRVDRAKGLLMSKMGLSEPESFRWIQKTSMDQRIPKKRLAMAIIAKYGEQKSEAEDER